MSDAGTIAYFVSPHGFGHASRAAAVMEALVGLRPGLRLEVFTTVPEWFFSDSLTVAFQRHPLRSDVGLVQRSPLEEDPAATAGALERFLPFDDQRLDTLARELQILGCTAVVVDIAPLGIAVAHRAGLPSILVENFTWDWIYEAYFESEPRLRRFADYFGEWFEKCTHWIQTEPVCRPVARARPVAPVSRAQRLEAAETRELLGVEPDRPIVLLTMGGAAVRLPFVEQLERQADLVFVAMANVEEVSRRSNVILLPERSPIYLPDLMAAADAVVGKVGYSTVAEAFAAGQRYAIVERPAFPEVPVLTAFVQRHLPAIDIPRAGFEEGRWIDRLPELLERPRAEARGSVGALAAAREIMDLRP